MKGYFHRKYSSQNFQYVVVLYVDYGPIFVIHLILVRYTIARLSRCFHYLLFMVLIHHDQFHGLLLLPLIQLIAHISDSCQCFPPSPMRIGKFSCLIPWSSCPFYIIKYLWKYIVILCTYLWLPLEIPAQ
jgi:hypothetical protein